MSAGILIASGLYSGWTYYEYTRSADDRRAVVLTKRGQPNKCLLLSRYLMETSIGRQLSSSEHVDHINNDRTDDRIENLQVLSASDNVMKSRKLRKWVTLKCPTCSTIFERPYSNVQCKLPEHVVCCSRRCADNKHTADSDGYAYVLGTYYK